MKLMIETGVSLEDEVYVMNGTGNPLLGRNTAIQLGVLKVELNINEVQPDVDITKEYADLFQGLGKLKDFQLKIPIRTEVPPVAQTVRRVAFSLREPL